MPPWAEPLKFSRMRPCPTLDIRKRNRYLGSTCGSGYGNHIRIDHEGAADGVGWVTIYAHMKQGSPVDAYRSVNCATYLGLTGSSGNSTGPHLHFEVRKYDYPNNDPFFGVCSSQSQPSGYWNNSSINRDVQDPNMSLSLMPTTQCVN